MSKWISTMPGYGPEVACCYAIYLGKQGWSQWKAR
jgi:hypothetical protein